MRTTSKKNCRDHEFLFHTNIIIVFLFLSLQPITCQAQAQDYVSFWGMELGTDIKKDSVFLREKGCRAFKNIFDSFVDFSYYETDLPTYISLHYSPLTKKVSEVYVLMMKDEDVFDIYNNKISNIYGKPVTNINGESFWHIKNKKGKTIGEACLLKEKADGYGFLSFSVICT